MATSEEGEVASKPRVSIRSLSGRTCHFDVNEDTTVEQLKHIIAGDMEIPVDRQRLLFQGKILTDGQLLKDAGCFNKVVHLVKRAELPANTSNPPPVSTTASDTPTPPVTGTTGAGVVFGGFPFMGAQQIFNNVWTMTPPTTSAAPTSTGPSAGTNPTSSQPPQGSRPIRTVPGILWETRHLLQVCGDALDRFDRGESMSTQDSTQSPPPGQPPSVSISSALLGDLYQTLVTVYERLIPLLREEARFLQEDRDLGEEERARRDRVSDCVRVVLERLHVCKIHLMNVSVSTSQSPPRTIQPTTRNRRRVTPHMTHVQVHINPSHSTQSNVPFSTTTSSNPTPSAPTTGESSFGTTPAPAQDPLPQPVMGPSPADLTNIFAQALSSIFPVNPDGTTQSAVPHNITGEAVIIQNGVMNSIPFGSGAGPMPSLIPPGLSIIELARSLYPGFIDDPGEDIFSRLLLLLCGMFTVEQLRGIVSGRVECLQGMYQRVKEFVTSVLVTGSVPAGEAQRRRGGELLATSTADNINGLFEALPSQENVNIKEVFVKFFGSHFYTAITLILDPRNEDLETSNNENRFGKVIWGWGHNMIRELCQLVDILARAGGTDIHSVLERYLTALIQSEGSGDIPLDFIQVMLRDSREKIDLIIRGSRLTDQQIKDKYITTVTSGSCISQPDTLVPVCTDWLPHEWKECIEEDSHIPATNQLCSSNSYLNFSGMTDNKEQKVPCSAEDMLCETIQQSITTSQVQPSTSIDEVMHDVRQNSTLKKRYNEFIDSNLTKRIRSDPNHTAERFPNSTARFKSDKS